MTRATVSSIAETARERVGLTSRSFSPFDSPTTIPSYVCAPGETKSVPRTESLSSAYLHTKKKKEQTNEDRKKKCHAPRPQQHR